MTRSIHLRFGKLPSGLASYPRVVLVRRPPIDEVRRPPEFRAHVERVVLQADEIARYAKVCGWQGGGDAVPATYPHILATPLHLKIFATSAFPLRPMGLIHVGNRIDVLGKLATGMAVSVDVAVRSYESTDAGITFDVESWLSNQGRTLWRETSSFLSRRAEGTRTKSGRHPRPPKAPRDARLLEELDVSLKTAWDYARVSNDFNPIHLSDPTARLFGLRGAISHGMWSLARALSGEPAVPPSKSRIDAQFLTPVGLPSRVALKEWTEEGTRRRALCDQRTGRVHLLVSVSPTSA